MASMARPRCSSPPEGSPASAAPPPAGAPTESSMRAGCVVCPGLIDLAARLREPGFEYMATLESEMDAAIAGGCHQSRLPARHRPVAGRARAGRNAQAPRPVAQSGARLSGRRADRRARRASTSPKWASWPKPAASPSRMPTRRSPIRRCCAARCSTRRPSATAVWLRPQDAYLARGGVAHDGEVATRLGLAGDSGLGGDHCAGHDLRAGAGNRRPRAHRATVDARGRGAGARGEARRPQGDLRRRHSPRPSVRHRHRLVRRAMPSGAAAAQRARPRRACARGSPTAR